MGRHILLDIRDWLGVLAAFGTVLVLTLAPHGAANRGAVAATQAASGLYAAND